MDMIERYLAAVRLILPAGQSEDIVAELREALLARREDRAEELGRALGADEEERLLRDFGHPMVVAARYGPQRYLIGPELYPIYLLVLKIVLAAVVGAAVLVGIVGVAVSTRAIGFAVNEALGAARQGGFAAISVVTIVFAVLQHNYARLSFLKNWRVRDLPQPIRARPPRRQTGFDHLAAIVVQIVFILWWTGAITLWRSHIPLEGDQSLTIGPAPIWRTLFWPVLGLSAGIVFVHAARLTRWGAGKTGFGLDLALQLALLTLASVALRAGRWVEVIGTGLPPHAITKVALGVDIGAQVTLIVIVCGAVLTAGWDLWRLMRPQADQT